MRKIYTHNDDMARFMGDSPMDQASLDKRNKSVIEWTIQKYELDREKRQKLYAEQIDERAEAIASFLKAVDRGYSGDSMRYFGRKELARLRGEAIVKQIKKATQMIVKK